MAAQPVEWVLIVYYGASAHRATYGRLPGTQYTKDYIQLSRKDEFLDAVTRLFPVDVNDAESVPLTYLWPAGSAPGALVFNSADRPHLKWETALGAPSAWRMSPTPSDSTAETIPGDPTHGDVTAAENELALLATRGAGQPYLVAIKLRHEARKLHLRAYLKDPHSNFAWADLSLTPPEVQALAAKTSKQSALAWALLHSDGVAPCSVVEDTLTHIIESADQDAAISALTDDVGRAVVAYLRAPGHGLFFDPLLNHDAWVQPKPLASSIVTSLDQLFEKLQAHFPATAYRDAAAEALETDQDEVDAFLQKIDEGSFEVPDITATVKVRGSAQKAFAAAVKANYGYQCAITGISSRDFLVASHIVPWSEDQTIRLDPTNGICLSLLVDRAFENGQLLIGDDLKIHINWSLIGTDEALEKLLSPYDGQILRKPGQGGPNPSYLQRRRSLISSSSPSS